MDTRLLPPPFISFPTPTNTSVIVCVNVRERLCKTREKDGDGEGDCERYPARGVVWGGGFAVLLAAGQRDGQGCISPPLSLLGRPGNKTLIQSPR